MTLKRRLAAAFLSCCTFSGAGAFAQEPARVLVFSETAGFRHDSIEAGIGLVRELGEQYGFAVDATEDSAVFGGEDLDRYATVIWLNTTGDVLDDDEQGGFQRYVEAGGGYVGVHSAADTEYAWPFYGELLGGEAWFRSHPAIQVAMLVGEDAVHPSSAHLPSRFTFTDEWYNFQRNPRPVVNVLLTLDEDSYDPGADGMGDHPIAWFHQPSGARAWYTGLGHRRETYAEGAFRIHLLGGILWTARLAAPPRTEVPCTGDGDGDGTVRIDELVAAVRNSLQGCPPPAAALVDNGDGTITDQLNGLMWEKKVSGSGCLHCVEDRMDWHTAMGDWIAQVNGAVFRPDDHQIGLAGYTDWRIPTLSELRTLPACVQCPNLTLGSAQRCSSDVYWSSSAITGSSDGAHSVSLNYGVVIGDAKGSPLCVRAVRGVR